MKLAYYCQNCRSRNSLRVQASDRVALQKKRGSEIPLKCKSCQEEHLYNPNNIEAVEDPIANAFVFVGMVIGIWLIKDWIKIHLDRFADYFSVTPYFILHFFILILLPIIVFGLFRSEHRKAIRLFNKYKV
jgi:hypothetical protein